MPLLENGMYLVGTLVGTGGGVLWASNRTYRGIHVRLQFVLCKLVGAVKSEIENVMIVTNLKLQGQKRNN